MYHRIAINSLATGKLPSGDPLWATFNDSFVNEQFDRSEIANAIYTGHAYTTWHEGRRCVDNFVLGQHLALDMDTGDKRSTFDALLKDEFIRTYAGILHTTPSHSPEAPRARVIFLLDKFITDAAAYHAASEFLIAQFDGADRACKDASRFFFGCKDCEIATFANVLPLDHLRSYYKRWKAAQPKRQTAPPPRTQTTEHKAQPDRLLEYAIQDAPGQGRNNRGYRLAAQLKEAGLSEYEAQPYMTNYQLAVERFGQHNYTEQEAANSLRSAYRMH